MLNNQQKKVIIISLLFLISALLFYACTHRSKNQDLKRYVEKVKAETFKRLVVNKAKGQGIEEPVPVAYQAESLRSPFGEAGKANQASLAPKEKEANPLLAYSLSVLKFVGTLKQMGIIYAFVLAPDGVIYQVRVGDEINDRHGKVVSIKERELIVQEQLATGDNKNALRMITMQLKDGRQ
jgi:Tfp pilus assembly protein PilP